MEPKGPKMEPKGPNMEPKGPKLEPKGPKMEPNGDQNASRIRFSKKVSSRERPVVRCGNSRGAVLVDGVAPGVDFRRHFGAIFN